MGEQAEDLNQMMSFFTVDDKKRASVQETDRSAPDGVERRSADRAWTAPRSAEARAEVAAPVPQRKAVANGGDQEWEEF